MAQLSGHNSRRLHQILVALDGELVCHDLQGRPDFYALLFGRRMPMFYALDLLALDGKDLRAKSLLERKRRLPAIEYRGLKHFCSSDGVIAHAVTQNARSASAILS